MDERLQVAQFEVAYAAFNAKRSLGTSGDRRASVRQTSDGISIRCPDAPANPYLNRLVSLGQPTFVPEGVLRVDRIGHDPVGASLRILAASPRSDTNVPRMEIARYEASRAAEFLRIVELASGERLGKDVIERKRAFYCSDAFRCFVAGKDGDVQGIATTFVREDLGWFANAFTFPAARRKGVHRALLDVRLADAEALGLKEVYTDVVPGSDSERNLLRAGFRHVAYYVSELSNS